jgi:large subunit ribosomal protein L11
MAEKVEVLVDGGKATPGPPLGPALGPLGINIVKVVAEINEKTKNFEGMKVPVSIVIEKDKSFTITVGTPPTTALIKAELGVEKATGATREQKSGDLNIDQIVKIARMKEHDLLGDSLKFKVKEVLGTCVSMGVTVEGMDPRDMQREIAKGRYADKLQ